MDIQKKIITQTKPLSDIPLTVGRIVCMVTVLNWQIQCKWISLRQLTTGTNPKQLMVVRSQSYKVTDTLLGFMQLGSQPQFHSRNVVLVDRNISKAKEVCDSVK